MDSLDYCVKASENAWSDDDTYTLEARANAALDAPAQALATALENMELSEQDRKYPAQMINQMKSEQDKINRSSYNEEARNFNAKVEKLSPMALVSPMADFSAPAAADVPDAPDIDDIDQRVDQWADNVESGVEGFVDGIMDGIFN